MALNFLSLLGSFLTSYIGAKPTEGASGLGALAQYDTPKPISFGDRLGQGLTGMGSNLFNNTKIGPFKLGDFAEFQKYMNDYKTKKMMEDLFKMFSSK